MIFGAFFSLKDEGWKWVYTCDWGMVASLTHLLHQYWFMFLFELLTENIYSCSNYIYITRAKPCIKHYKMVLLKMKKQVFLCCQGFFSKTGFHCKYAHDWENAYRMCDCLYHCCVERRLALLCNLALILT